MKQRILVAVIGIPLLLLVLCWLSHWATAALLAALGVIGAHELLAAVSGPEKTKRLWVLAGVLAVLTVFATYAGREEYKGTVLAAAPWLLCAAAKCCGMCRSRPSLQSFRSAASSAATVPCCAPSTSTPTTTACPSR